MLEIRYRATYPGAEQPFAPWFRRASGARVHITDVRFRGDDASARFVAFPADDEAVEPLVEDMVAFPLPFSRRWEVEERRERAVVFRAEWREPVFPGGVPSAMRFFHDFLGEGTIIALTVLSDAIVHRYLVPENAYRDDLWARVEALVRDYSAATRSRPTVELERFQRFAPASLEAFRAEPRVLVSAFALGYYDEPPRATLHDVAVSAAVHVGVARAALERAEVEILSAVAAHTG